ncbi:MAG TPA: diguanylate cyclase [Sulfuricella sp.]|nr:diguanylate cyclase [Sulfuricella sp.]
MGLSHNHLSTRITLAGLALVLGMALLLFTLVDRHRRENLLVESRAELDDSLRLYDTRMRQTVETLRQDVVFLSRTPPVSGIRRASRNGGIDPLDGNTAEKWKTRLQEIFAAFSDAHPNYYQIRYIGVADGGREIVRVVRKNGHVSVVPENRLQRKADRDYFKATIKLPEKETFLSEINLNQEAGQIEEPHVRTLSALTPIYAPDGSVFGMMSINMDVGALLDTASVTHPPFIRSYLTNMKGDYLVHPDPGQSFGFELGKKRLIQQDFPGLAALFEGNTPDHWSLHPIQAPTGRVYVAAERIHYDPRQQGHFIALVHVMPDSVVEKQIAPERRQIVWIVLVSTLLILGLVFVIIKRLFLPLRNFTEAANIIATGRYDARLPDISGGEIGSLATAFSVMQDRVSERERDYQQLTGILEQRVKERTVELEARQADLSLAASVFHNTMEGILITDANGIIISVNPAFTEITGYSAEEAIDHKPSLIRSDHHGPAFYRSLWDTLLREGRWQGEIWNRRKNGEAFLERLTINKIDGPDGKPVRYVAVFNDITEMHRKDEHIRHQAFHDALTGLPNRALLLDRMAHSLEIARRENYRICLMFIDLDRFKPVNDTLGHDVGDALLQEVSHRLTGCLRSADTVARLGGDEFVIMMERTEEVEDCTPLAKKVIATLSEAMTVCGHDIQIGASIGIASFPDDGTDVATLMKHADAAMYSAKSAGRGVFRFFQPAMAGDA